MSRWCTLVVAVDDKGRGAAVEKSVILITLENDLAFRCNSDIPKRRSGF